MNRHVLLALCLFALTLIGPLFALGQSGSWRQAWRAWIDSLWYWAFFAVPAAVVAGWMYIFGT